MMYLYENTKRNLKVIYTTFVTFCCNSVLNFTSSSLEIVSSFSVWNFKCERTQNIVIALSCYWWPKIVHIFLEQWSQRFLVAVGPFSCLRTDVGSVVKNKATNRTQNMLVCFNRPSLFACPWIEKKSFRWILLGPWSQNKNQCKREWCGHCDTLSFNFFRSFRRS